MNHTLPLPPGHYFLTGTDTEIGKTHVAVYLLRQAVAAGWRAIGLKPVACGCNPSGRNEDVERLKAASNHLLPDSLISPYIFPAPISPHLAARQQGQTIDFARIVAAVDAVRPHADLLIVEGVGGWYAPLTDHHTVADLAQQLALPILLVVGLRLGCLNHALLTAEAILARSLPLFGWIANTLDPSMEALSDNIATLRARLPAPLLAVIPYTPGL
ncbi:MAG: dethiobiotin synthase [Hydrogenophilus sp.]|nr:dethiobiotin synthase [Hydrogenophilus sp.]